MHSSLALTLGLMAAGACGSPLVNDTLAYCLEQAGTTYYLPSSTDWATYNSPFNSRVKFNPTAIAVPKSAKEAQGALLCGRQKKLKVTPKTGGHSYASLGFGGEDGHLVIQLDHMIDISVDNTTKIATVAAGARLGHLATQLYNQGQRAIAHGTCPGVGVSGHVLHGGFGMSSHTHGLALDWVVGISVLLANGTIVDASSTQNSDLFWAMLGAGSNFGIALSYKFKTFEAPKTVTVFSANLGWTQTTAAAGLEALDNWTRNTMPANLNMRLAGGNRQSTLEGTFIGNQTEFTAALQPLLSLTGGSISSSTTTDWMGSIQNYAYTSPIDLTYPYDVHETFYSKSLTLTGLKGQAAKDFAKYWFVTAPSNSRYWWFQLDLQGGVNSFTATANTSLTSYAHRDKLFIIQFYDRTFFGDYPSNGFPFLDNWVANTTSSLTENDWGMYINYADARLDRDTAQKVYWRNNLPQLQKLKAKYDPDELFYYPISIKPSA
ncbi:Glucooligosaccharide oxidase [Xylariaceae sp. FL1651]|nr:Glucooligosaccharide oxidase [Xylariaceae sp. FL1651]